YRVTESRDQSVDLASRQLAAFAGLGALGNLDLQHFGIDQVFRGDTKPAGGDLLDLGALERPVARRVFATLTGVGARAEPVHRLGDRLVGLRRQCAEGNPGRVEALEDVGERLDLVQRQRLVSQLDLEQVADHRYRTVVDQRAVFLVGLVAALLHGSLQRADHMRVVGVVFTTVDELEQAARLDRLAAGPGFSGEQLLLGFQIDETRTLDPAGDAAEAQLDDVIGQADR